MDIKPGTQTTEFRQTAVVNLIAAIVALVAAFGLVTSEQADLLVQVGTAIVALVMPMVMAYVTTRYANGRVAVKVEALRASGQVIEIGVVEGDDAD